MTTFAENKETRSQVLFCMRGIALDIQPFSDRKLVVSYEGSAVMGEGTPFYHIFCSAVKISSNQCLFNLFVAEESNSSMVLTFDPYTGDYQMNKYLTDEVKEVIRQTIGKLNSDAVVAEVAFIK